MQGILTSYLVNAAWQIPIVAVCAFVVSRFGGVSPRARNRLWLMFLAAAAILPAISLRDLIPHPSPVVARVSAGPWIAAPIPEPAVASVAPAAPPVFEIAPWAGWAMSALVAAFAAAVAIRLAFAALAARRLVRQSRPAELPSAAAEALEALASLHNRHTPPVLKSAAVRSPAVVGAFRPVILMPENLTANADELRAALLHEMAHVVRHDYAVNLACELFTLPVCWHPALMGLKAGVHRSRELACDAIAASAMASRKTYARCLVSLAHSLGEPSDRAAPTQAALAVGLFGRSDLEDRLMQLMKPRDTESPFVGAARACGLAALGASVLGSAALLHVTPVMAQTQPVAAAEPVAIAAIPAAAAAAAAAPEAPVAAVPPVPPTTPVPPHRHGHMTYSHNGVTIERGGPNGHRHTWTGADGVSMAIVNDDPNEPTADEKRAYEAQAKEAEARAAKALAYVSSPEFKAKIDKAAEAGAKAAQISAKAAAASAKAEAFVNSAEFKAKIAKAETEGKHVEALMNSPEFKAKIAKAAEAAKRTEAILNSPEFKAKIARAEAASRRAEAVVNSPEFKAKMAKAEEAGRKAAAFYSSPEFRAQMERLGDDIARQMDDLPTPPAPPRTPTP